MQTPLVLTLLGLLFLLIALVFLYVWLGRSPKSDRSPQTIETFETLSAVILDRSASRAELHRAVGIMLERFATINSHTLPAYERLMESLCVHPRADSKIVLRFEKTLRRVNPKYDHQIEHALRLGLAARG
ncbi:MAG: hypothetical protein AB1763_03120 [Campylobacterota bacterium]